MTQALQAQLGGTTLLSPTLVQAQGASTLVDTSKDSIWNTDLVSAKPAARTADPADDQASFAHTLRQKRQDTDKTSDTQDSQKTSDSKDAQGASDRHSDTSRVHRKRAKKADESRGDGEATDKTRPADKNAAVRNDTTVEPTDESQTADQNAKPADAAGAEKKPTDPVFEVKSQAVDASAVKTDVAEKKLPETARVTDQQATAPNSKPVDAKADAAPATTASAAAAAQQGAAQAATQVVAQGASKSAPNGSDKLARAGNAENGSTTTPANIAALDQLLRRRGAPSRQATVGTQPKNDQIPAAQGANAKDAEVRTSAISAAQAKSKAKASVGDSKVEGPADVVQGSTKPPEPASASAPKVDQTAPAEEPAPPVPVNQDQPAAQPAANAPAEVSVPSVAPVKTSEPTAATESEALAASAAIESAPSADGPPVQDAAATLPQIQQTMSSLKTSTQASTQSTPAQDGATQFQKALQSQVERGISIAMQQAAASAGAGDVNIGAGGVVLRLHPAHLGQLKVQLKFEPAGKGGPGGVRARFEASSAKAKGILDGSMDSLRSALEDRGLRVDEVVVAQSPRMPERDVGLPMPDGHPEAGNAGAGFAGSDNRPAQSDTGGGPGNERQAAAETGGDVDAGSLFERPVRLSGLPWTVGPDGRIRVDALV
jgi:hypothetical protein